MNASNTGYEFGYEKWTALNRAVYNFGNTLMIKAPRRLDLPIETSDPVLVLQELEDIALLGKLFL
jgi:hypothetical protein